MLYFLPNIFSVVVDFPGNKFLSNQIVFKNSVLRVKSFILQSNHLIDNLLIDSYVTRSNKRFSVLFIYKLCLPKFWVIKLTFNTTWFFLCPKQLGGVHLLESQVPCTLWNWNLHQRIWLKAVIDEVITLVTWLMCILQTRTYFCWYQQRLKNAIN